MCDSATHLGHFIASTDKKSIVKSAKSCFWRSFNIFMSDFGQLSYIVKCKFQKKNFNGRFIEINKTIYMIDSRK